MVRSDTTRLLLPEERLLSTNSRPINQNLETCITMLYKKSSDQNPAAETTADDSSSVSRPLTNPLAQIECGDEKTVTATHPLSSIKAEFSSTTISGASSLTALINTPSAIAVRTNSSEKSFRWKLIENNNKQQQDEPSMCPCFPDVLTKNEFECSPSRTGARDELTNSPLHVTSPNTTKDQGTSRTGANHLSINTDSVVGNRTNGKTLATILCRICHETDVAEMFISPCNCKGSLSLVHKQCLERWLGESGSSHCELCGHIYDTVRHPKYNLFISVFAWFFASNNKRGRRILVWDIFSFFLLLPLMIVGTSLGMRTVSEELPPVMSKNMSYLRIQQLSVAMFTVLLDVGITTWFLVRMQYHFIQWVNWYKRSYNVTLLGYNEPASVRSNPQVHQVSTRPTQEVN